MKITRSYLIKRITRELETMLPIHLLAEYNRFFRSGTKDSPDIKKKDVDWGK